MILSPIEISNLRASSEQALKSAKQLFDAGDWEGTCDRAYYAMFKLVLVAMDKQSKSLSISLEAKTHRGLIGLFSKYFVKTHRIDPSVGSYFSSVYAIRERADYGIASVTKQDAATSLARANAFCAALDSYLENRSIVSNPDKGYTPK